MIYRNLKYFFKTAWEQERAFYLYLMINFLAVCVFAYNTIHVSEIVLNMVQAREINISLLLITFTSLLVSGLIASLCKIRMTPAGYRIRYTLLSRIMKQNLSIPFSVYEDPKHLNDTWTVYRSVSSIDGVQGFFLNITDFSSNLATIAVSISVLLNLSMTLAAFVFIWMIIYIYLFIQNSNALDELYKKNRSTYREYDYIADLGTDFSYAKDIRVYKMQGWLKSKFDSTGAVLTNISKQYETLSVRLNMGDSIYQLIRDVLMYGILIRHFFVGAITLGEFSMYSVLVMQLNGALSSAALNIKSVFSHHDNYDKMIKYLELDPQNDQGELIDMNPDWEVKFEDVTFRYPGTDINIYEHLNFTIRKGKRIAIVGLNGVGKSTLIKLLMRLYKPTEGQITLNGKDIQDYSLDAYFKLFAPVFQDINVFPYSLKENLIFDEDIDDPTLLEAMKHSDFINKFNSFEKGLNTELTRYISEEGTNLSGGEAQKLVMARAIAYNRPIMVLDEPTSALDAVAEYNFYHNISEGMNDKTILFVSHRLASTSFCDEIILIEDKTISEWGTHAELISKGGSYFKLFNTQAQYYREEVTSNEA